MRPFYLRFSTYAFLFALLLMGCPLFVQAQRSGLLLTPQGEVNLKTLALIVPDGQHEIAQVKWYIPIAHPRRRFAIRTGLGLGQVRKNAKLSYGNFDWLTGINLNYHF